MSKAQKLISGIFAFVFALVIAPTASFAATNYNLSVNGCLLYTSDAADE